MSRTAVQVAAALVLVFLSLVAILSLAFPSDAIGAWARVTGAGSILGLMLASSSVLVDLIRRRLPSWVRAQMLLSGSIVLCLASYGGSAAASHDDLQSAITHAQAYTGCLDLQLPARPDFIVCPDGDNSDGPVAFRVRRTRPLPTMTISAVRAAEDLRQPFGLTPIDSHGLARAARYLGKAGGGSGVCQQLSRMLLQVSRSGTPVQRIFRKAKVAVGCDALDGITRRDQQMETYADLVDMGGIGATRIQGLAAASYILYGKELEALTWHEDLELASLINAPSRSFPLQRPGESFLKAAARQDHLRQHFLHVIENARNNHLITDAEADQAQRDFGSTFLSVDQLPQVLPPTSHLVRAAINAAVPDHSARFLKVESAYDPAAQLAVERGIDEGLQKVAPLLRADERDLLQADVALLNADGSESAVANLATVATDVGSVQKVQLYSFALARHCLASMQAKINGTPAEVALPKSDNQAAHAVIECAGPHPYTQYLALQGWKITNPALIELSGYDSVATGSGVSASPLQVASMLRMYDLTTRPGILVEPSFLVRVTDATTGKLLYQPQSHQIVSPAIAADINHALRGTAIIGTTRRVLGDLAKEDPSLISKTGTPAFFRRGVIHGGGGSWICVGDDRYFFAVRVELRGGHEIGLDGAVAAGPVANAVLRQLRHPSSTTNPKEGHDESR